MAEKPGSLRLTLTGNPAEDARHRDLVEDLRIPIACPLLRGRAVTVTLPVGSVTFNHLLARLPQGMLVTDQLGAAPSFFRTAWTDRSITLTSAVACTVTFWVY